ncbi:Vacuolar protein sorting/targeting protein 10 [Penicillium angulare]|uniref:Vacuolar protein sorting/targeting protein 10 n=1 Tax=Penicillium angulare TaxID=116970 RepID=UPI00254191E2|nr:Vacuolar protein sorting/targeting protein 10 [Penicillium angulare]KAJ5260505.1 Vacuolar protein sorting/targeting protein 10 [Penicillium angulare]
MITRWLLLVVGLLLALATQPIAAKGDKPKVTTTELDHQPLRLFYFEGTNTILYQDEATLNAHVSFDGGEEWKVVKGDDESMEGKVRFMIPHPHDNHRAYVIGPEDTHWITTDQGKSWKSFKMSAAPFISMRADPISFNGWDPSKAIFLTIQCNWLGCMTESFYTTDDFKTIKPLREAVYECRWAASTPEFGLDLDLPKSLGDRVLCVVPGLKVSDHTERLLYSDNFFPDNNGGTEVKLNLGQAMVGQDIKVRSVKKYMVAGVQSRGTTEQALYVSDDSTEWHRAEFSGHRMEKDAYTLLESTNYSIQLDVQTTWNASRVGALFSSNSNGTYFSPNIEHTNRDLNGLVDFEKVADIQGIVIVNTVKNWEEVEESDKNKKELISQISFDDGRTFQSLKEGSDKLHLHSMTTYDELRKLSGLGRMFSSPAPGLVMGVGNTGDHLKDYSDAHLYVSDDAGLNWRHALKGPHRFEFGDQGGIIVAVKDGEKTKKVEYSIDHGKEWEELELKHEVKALFLTTTPDSTSLKFILVGVNGDEDDGEYIIYSIDFESLHERKCTKDDIEKWTARVDEDGKADCLMGHKQFFERRKANANCFMKNEFKMDAPEFEKCKCSAEDFECDYNFKRSEDRKECVPAISLTAPAGKCKEPSEKYMGPSGWRLIPGNVCIREGGEQLDKEVERSCGNSTSSPSPITDGKVHVGEPQTFSTSPAQYFYLERQESNLGDDETVFMANNLQLYISHDHGKTWKQPAELKSEKILAMIQHPFYTDGAYFLTDGGYVYSTIDRGYSFNKFKWPTSEISKYSSPMEFHEKYQDWMIWIGTDGCTGNNCVFDAYLSKNRGHEWELMLRGVSSCKFAYNEKREDSEKLVICEQYVQENSKNNRQLVSTETMNDWADKKLINEDIARFVMMNDYVVVATYPTEKHKFLNVSTSLDGRVFAEAQFPFNIDVAEYTVLPGSSYALLLYVEVNDKEGQYFGSLVKSNSNGTYFVQSLAGLNSNNERFVDFEKMVGIEGVALANTVVNKEDVLKKGADKKLVSVITHNDGGQWMLLAPPTRDAEDKKFDCSVTEGEGTSACALHLHSYTERRDSRDTFYSDSAVGLMVGIGNVGQYLSDAKDADTFLSRDGGFTWKQAKKGRYMFEFGDAGSIIVLVREQQATKVVHYSLDEGDKWSEFQFSETEMVINDISTLPSDTSKNFLLWAEEKSSGKLTTINLDFSGVWDRQCEASKVGGDNDDYYLWTPQHPAQQDGCLFGHIEQYQRKKPNAECWNNWRTSRVHRIEAGNCTCTRADFECDYNYEIQNDGSCGLVPGLTPPDHSLQCKEDPDRIQYWEPTGYRKLTQSTCQSAEQDLDRQVPHACPNKEEEFKKKHGTSGVVLFFAIVLPIAAAAAIGYFVYTKWDGKFGQIRLGERSVGSSGDWFNRDSPLVAVPVAIIAGLVAVAQSLPLLASSMWRSVSGIMPGRRGRGYQRPYSTPGSFAARRGDYVHVVDDEDELLGADEFDDDEEA